MNINEFHDNPLYISKDLGCTYKNIHILAASQSRLRNVVLNKAKDIVLFTEIPICK